MNSKSKGNWKIGLNTSVNKQTLRTQEKKGLLELRYRKLKKSDLKTHQSKQLSSKRYPFTFRTFTIKRLKFKSFSCYLPILIFNLRVFDKFILRMEMFENDMPYHQFLRCLFYWWSAVYWIFRAKWPSIYRNKQRDLSVYSRSWTMKFSHHFVNYEIKEQILYLRWQLGNFIVYQVKYPNKHNQ